MIAGPHAEQIVHESLTDGFDAPKVQLGLSEPLQSSQQSLGLATAHELGSQLEQFDDSSGKHELMVHGELLTVSRLAGVDLAAGRSCRG